MDEFNNVVTSYLLTSNKTLSVEYLTTELMNFSDFYNTTEIPYTPYSLRPETYIVPTLFALIFLVGVLGNGTLVIVFLRHRAMRNVPNT